MREDPKTDRMKVSFEELAYSDMVVVEALVQLLVEKGLLTRPEVMERVKQVRPETKVNFVPKEATGL